MDLIRPWAEEGTLPGLRRLIDEGASGTVRAAAPLSTPHLWANIFTGVNAGLHGIFDYWQRGQNGRFEQVKSSSLSARPIWEILTDSGLTAAIVNAPLTYPPQPIKGFMISGLDALGSHRSIASPPEVYDGLVNQLGAYEPYAIFPGGKRKRDYLGLLEREVPRLTKAFRYLLEEHEWDFALVYFPHAAVAQHYFWGDMQSQDEDNPYRDLIRNTYEALDAAIAELATAAGADAMVFVVSECGAGPLRYGVNINTWLEREGFVCRTSSTQGSGASGSVVGRLRLAALNSVGGLGVLAKRYLPESAYLWVGRHVSGVKTWAQNYMMNSDIDWKRSQAFSRGKEGNIFINLKGRDYHGIVEPGREYENVRDRIISRLSQLKDPDTGEDAVTRVYKGEEMFTGPLASCAPDLVIEWRDAMYMPTEQERDRDRIFVTRWREGMSWPTTGSHRFEGVFLAAGPSIKRSVRVEASLFDLLPTWLQALGQPLPDGLHGKVIPGLFRDAITGRDAGKTGPADADER